MIRRYAGAALALALAAAGCSNGQKTVGGAKADVVLNASPADAEIYLIPYSDWKDKGGPQLLRDADALRAYARGRAPQSLTVTRYRHVYAASHNGKFMYREIMPGTGAGTFALDLSE